MGTTLREVVFDIGGGIKDDRKFKAVQIGGPSGGCLPESLLDLPVDYESLTGAGAIMGSGGLVVADEDTCMVDLARFFLQFVQNESCGKCVPCRIGTLRMLEILNRITEGKGVMEDVDTLTELATRVKELSLCGLGQTAPNPVLSTVRYFRDEYEAHIKDKKCPAGVCQALTSYTILAEKCRSCGLCAKVCPSGAIEVPKMPEGEGEGESGEELSGRRVPRKKPYEILQDRCIKCGACEKECRFDAILRR